jgi:hypothetical protein
VEVDLPSHTEFTHYVTSLITGFAAPVTTKHDHSFPNEHANGNIIKIPLTMNFQAWGRGPPGRTRSICLICRGLCGEKAATATFVLQKKSKMNETAHPGERT